MILSIIARESLREPEYGSFILTLHGWIVAKRALEDGLIYGYHDDHLTRLQAILLLWRARIRR